MSTTGQRLWPVSMEVNMEINRLNLGPLLKLTYETPLAKKIKHKIILFFPEQERWFIVHLTRSTITTVIPHWRCGSRV